MRSNASRRVLAVMVTTVAASTLVIPTAGSATAATDPGPRATGVAVNDIGQTCKKKPRNYVVRNYYRGPKKYTLRCGTARWGWKHIHKRHRWNKTMDKKISAAIWSGQPNGRGGYSTYSAQCPPKEVFRTLIGTPAGPDDLLTAYRVTRVAAKC